MLKFFRVEIFSGSFCSSFNQEEAKHPPLHHLIIRICGCASFFDWKSSLLTFISLCTYVQHMLLLDSSPVTCIYPLSPLRPSATSLVLLSLCVYFSPQAKKKSRVIHCAVMWLLLLAALSTRRDRLCVPCVDLGGHLFHPRPRLLSPSLHTYTHTQTERDEAGGKQNAPVNNLSLYSREPKWSLSK